MDETFNFRGTIGFGDSNLELLIRHFEVFRIHAKVDVAAGAVWLDSGKSTGYCYVIGLGTNSSLPGHVAGLLFCLYVKLFLPLILNSVDFWGSMSSIVLDKKLTEKKIKKSFIVGSTRFLILSTKDFST